MKKTIRFICNNEIISAEINPAISTLDFIRTELHLTGTKESCREGDCGACSILCGKLCNDIVKYRAVNSCILPIGAIAGKHIVTIEGLNQQSLTPVQQSFVKENGAQCGFCTPGFIISLTGSLFSCNEINYENLISSIDGNICRCTGYASIKRSVKSFTENYSIKITQTSDRIHKLVRYNILPEYFLSIPQRLSKLRDFDHKAHTGIPAAGCTDLSIQNKNKIERRGINLIDRESKSPHIYIENKACLISAFTTVKEICESKILNKIFPGIKNYFSMFGSTQIRNRATIGGNIINASPIGDLSIFFLPFNTILYFREGEELREVRLSELYKGYKQLDKKPTEILEIISFEIPVEEFKINFEKVSRRTYLDIACVNSAILILANQKIIKHVSISAGGVAPFPMLLKDTAKYLKGKEVCLTNLKEACVIASKEISPISDVRGSAEYKAILLKQLILSHFLKLFPDIIKAEDFVC